MTTRTEALRIRVAVSLVVLFSVLVRLHSASALWLDEALSVNIAGLPLHELPEALRRDGSPPLYYLLLHGWMTVFGSGTTSVRVPSEIFGIGALPLAWLLGRRLRDSTTGWAAVLLLGTSPFAIRYSTETRMYSMVVVLVLLGGLALHAALQRPTLPRLIAVSAVSGLLLLTHYWALYVLAVVGLPLLVLSRRSRAARRCAAALAAGGLLFLPWLPSFLFQVRHTGTPWARPPGAVAITDTLNVWTGGHSLAGALLGLVLVALVILALIGREQDGSIVLRRPVDRTAAALTLVALGTLGLGVGLAAVSSAGYSPRYSSAALTPFLIAAALGVSALPGRARTAVLGVAVLCGMLGSYNLPFTHRRTDAPLIARALRAGLHPGDLVVYCPDQLGPAVSRLLPGGVDQVVYPTMGGPRRVDWVDYAQRNERASPQAFVARILARTSGSIWLVSAGHYLTFGQQCEDVDTLLSRARGGRAVVVPEHKSYDERALLTRYQPAAAARAAKP